MDLFQALLVKVNPLIAHRLHPAIRQSLITTRQDVRLLQICNKACRLHLFLVAVYFSMDDFRVWSPLQTAGMKDGLSSLKPFHYIKEVKVCRGYFRVPT